MSSNNAPTGIANPTDLNDDLNAYKFLISQVLSKVQTATLVMVKSVTNDGGLSPVGTVDVLPLVSQIDGAGNTVPHAQINEVPYCRIQGGSDAIIIDPKVGDIGLAVFASRDISAAKANKNVSPPGSRRRYNMADALYIGGFLNGTPTQYLQFTDEGIVLTSTGDLTLNSPTNVNINAPMVTASQDMTIIRNLIVKGNIETPGTITDASGTVGKSS